MQIIPKGSPINPTQPTPEFRQPDTNVNPSEGAGAQAGDADQTAQKLALLAKREQELSQLRKQLEANDASFKEKESDLIRQGETTFKESLKARAINDPLKVMEELGLTHEQLTQLIMNPPTPESQEIAKLKSEIEALRSESQKRFEEQQTNSYKQAVEQIRGGINSLAQSDERFEMSKEMGGVEAAVHLVERTFKETGRIMTNEEALLEVETYLVNEALRIAKLKKVQEKLTPKEAPKEVPQGGSGGLNTLTNQVGNIPSRPLSSKDRIARAIAIAKGELKP